MRAFWITLSLPVSKGAHYPQPFLYLTMNTYPFVMTYLTTTTNNYHYILFLGLSAWSHICKLYLLNWSIIDMLCYKTGYIQYPTIHTLYSRLLPFFKGTHYHSHSFHHLISSFFLSAFLGIFLKHLGTWNLKQPQKVRQQIKSKIGKVSGLSLNMGIYSLASMVHNDFLKSIWPKFIVSLPLSLLPTTYNIC